MSKFDTMAFTVTADTYWPRKIVIDFPIQPGEEYGECLQMQFNGLFFVVIAIISHYITDDGNDYEEHF